MHVVPVLVQVVVTCVHVMYMYMLLQQGHTQLHNIVACVNGVCPVQYYGQLTATSLSQLHSPDLSRQYGAICKVYASVSLVLN